MREIRPLNDREWDDYAAIQLNAYPGVPMKREQIRERAMKMNADPTVTTVGLLEEGSLLGVMRLHDFKMKLLSTTTLVGGVGGVAVDLVHKKEKVAYDMLQFFLRHYRQKGACLTALYPFRPDFYKQMGFGYGRKLNQYHIQPAHLPQGPTKTNVTLLSSADRRAFDACYNRVMAQTNGLMENSAYVLDSLFSSDILKVAACWQGDEIRGYIMFQFEPVRAKNFLSNQMVVRALVYEETAVLYELLTFLRSQADQIETIVLNTYDEDFHLLLYDPRNTGDLLYPMLYQESNTQGVGIMYRVIDVPRLFEVLCDHDFGGQTCRVKLVVADSFLPENGGEWVLAVSNGRAELQSASAAHDIVVRLDVAEFSSLITGATEFKTLHCYGLAHISDAAFIQTIHDLFFTDNKPICLTAF